MKSCAMVGSLCIALLALTAACRAQVGDDSPGAALLIPPETEPTTQPSSPSRVVAVTVYQGTALVTREVVVAGAAGVNDVIVTPLPPLTLEGSLYTEGGDGIRVLTTRLRTRAVKEDVRKDVRVLQQQIADLEAGNRDLQKQIEVATQNLQFLSKLEGFTAATMQQLMEKGMLNTESTQKLATFVMESRALKSKEVTTLNEKVQKNTAALEFGQRQLGELTSGAARTVRDAVIVVDKANAAGGKVRLNYLVSAATWRPMYRFRAGKEKEPVTLESLAEILQHSGESWDSVALTLSTAEPMLNAAPPELLSLDVTVSGGKVSRGATTQPTLLRDNIDNYNELRRQSQRELNANRGAEGWMLGNAAAALQQSSELLSKDEERAELAAATAAREGQSVTYHLKEKLTVPSRNDPQLIEVARSEFPPEYFYKAVPVLSQHVYRLAKLTNKSDSVLLPGEATMYLGTDFVGRMNVPLVAVGEQFTVGFGVDPQIQVVRELSDKAHSIQGGNQLQTYKYRIRVSSFKSEPVTLQVWDRLPRGEAETVGIVLGSTSPDLSNDPAYQRTERAKNLLRWDVNLQPGSTGEKAVIIEYNFKMEYARDVSIGNFRAVK